MRLTNELKVGREEGKEVEDIRHVSLSLGFVCQQSVNEFPEFIIY